jgi:hypothetical protein
MTFFEEFIKVLIKGLSRIKLIEMSPKILFVWIKFPWTLLSIFYAKIKKKRIIKKIPT